MGFVHAGFGPDAPVDPIRPLELNHELGTVAMLVVEPDLHDSDLVAGLISEAERYLERTRGQSCLRGRTVSVKSFLLGDLRRNRGIRSALGASAVSQRAYGEGLPAGRNHGTSRGRSECPEPRDPRGVLIRRQAQIEFQDDALPAHWWQCLALGDFQLLNVRLVSRDDRSLLGQAQAWDMSWFGRGDSRSRIGLISLEVPAAHRRKGYGRFLVSEIFRRARENHVDLIAVQTAATNAPALALYAFARLPEVEEATCFRLQPSTISDRNSKCCL